MEMTLLATKRTIRKTANALRAAPAAIPRVFLLTTDIYYDVSTSPKQRAMFAFVRKTSARRGGDNGSAAASWGIFGPVALVRIYHVESNGPEVRFTPQPLEAGSRAKWCGIPSASARFGREAIFRRR